MEDEIRASPTLSDTSYDYWSLKPRTLRSMIEESIMDGKACQDPRSSSIPKIRNIKFDMIFGQSLPSSTHLEISYARHVSEYCY